MLFIDKIILLVTKSRITEMLHYLTIYVHNAWIFSLLWHTWRRPMFKWSFYFHITIHFNFSTPDLLSKLYLYIICQMWLESSETRNMTSNIWLSNFTFTPPYASQHSWILINFKKTFHFLFACNFTFLTMLWLKNIWKISISHVH